MKKIFIASFLLPFSLLGFDMDNFLITEVSIYTNRSSSGFTQSTTSGLKLSLSALDTYLFSRPNASFGISIASDGFQPFAQSLTNASLTVNHPFKGVDSNGSVLYFGWSSAPSFYRFFPLVVSLYNSGYTNFDHIKVGAQTRINFTPSHIVSDVLFGTNTFYRSVLLSHLGNISSSVSSIDSNLSLLLQSLNSSPSYTYSNIVSSAEGLRSFASNNGFNLDLDKIEFDTNPSNWDLNDPEGRLAYQAALDSYGKGLQKLSDLVGLASALNSSNGVDSRYNGLQQLGNAINGSVDASINDFKRLSTNWQEGVKKDLQDWRNDVTNRLAHMFDDSVPIDGGNSSPVYVSGQNGGPVGVAGVVRLEGPISVGATIEGAVTLDSTQFNQFSSGWESIKQSIIDFHNSFTDFTSSGDLPFNWISFYRLFYDFQDHSLSNQLALIRSFSVTNILNDIYAAITNNSTNVVLSAMLLDDYETFIDSSKFSDMLLSMPENLASTLRSFGLADSSEYAGRWWVFQTANSMLQSQMLITNATLSALALSALNDIDKSFDDDDSEDSSLLSRWLSILSTLPDKEELDQAIESASNIVNNVGFERVYVFYDRATNDFSAAISTMYQDRSLPTFLRITLVPESHGRPPRFVDIPVAERAGLWSLFRSGMAYGLSIVTLILFPKYILWLLTRYTRLMEKIIKSLKAYTEM